MSIKSIPYICDYCGETHLITKSQHNKLLSGKQKHSFCSIRCKSSYQQNGTNIKCENCGKVFYRRKYHAEKNNNNFCCMECYNEFYSKQAREVRVCEQCGKEYIVLKAHNQRFCSPSCNSKWQSTLLGKDNPKFIQKIIRCDYCDKEFYTMNYRIKKEGKNFCSVKCRQEWFSKIWSQQEEWKEKSRKKIIETLSSGKMSSVETKPQVIVNSILDELKINYQREFPTGHYLIDNYLTDNDLMIEVQGDYWHCSPIKFHDKINSRQSFGIRRDKSKHTYILNKFGINILYLWEYDIIHNLELCKKLILEYVSMRGQLKNYHSFNYIITDDCLNLKSELIKPYQEQEYEIYKNKIIKAS